MNTGENETARDLMSDAGTRHTSSSSISEKKAVKASVGKFIKNAKRTIKKGCDLDVVVVNDKTDASKRIHDVKTKKWGMKHTWEHESLSSSRNK